MKTQRFFYFLIITVLFSACKKEIDYRDKWIGTYECEEIYSYSFGPGGDPNSSSGREIYQVKVVVKAKGNNFVDFFMNRNEKHYEANISEDGSFDKFNDTEPHSINGNFHADSLNMTIVYSYSAGHSRVSYFKGKKQK